MAAPEFTGVNKVNKGQELFSLSILAGRISNLEAREKELTNQINEQDKELDSLVKLVADLSKKLEQHIKFGHPNNKPQEIKK